MHALCLVLAAALAQTTTPPASEGEAPALSRYHCADSNHDGIIDLSESMRCAQLLNSDGYSCAPGTEDGYAPGAGDQSCTPHDADTNQDWKLSLPELLRVTQFYNSWFHRYRPATGTEDGFEPYPSPLSFSCTPASKQTVHYGDTIYIHVDTTNGLTWRNFDVQSAATWDTRPQRVQGVIPPDSVIYSYSIPSGRNGLITFTCTVTTLDGLVFKDIPLCQYNVTWHSPVTLQLSTNQSTVSAGDEVPINVALDLDPDYSDLTAIGGLLQLPAAWKVLAVSGDHVPDIFKSSEDQWEFAWYENYNFPILFTAIIEVPAMPNGSTFSLSGYSVYTFEAGEYHSSTSTITLKSP